ncbi:hypothetical protein SAY86_008239 [Trapa natans]|uniref:Protein BIG GRAIN 1-like E n=1 Tax=Trapa natans TaxID=22666 RepID=A0AAN7KED7_TRANT|nr:hypothetical protein SAY86_008239 [Trapa natans]
MSFTNSHRSYRRDDSGELDVFEAARYFSGYTDSISPDYNNVSYSRKTAVDRGNVAKIQPTGDAGHFRSSERGHYATPKEKLTNGNEHGHRKQPSSPGGRLASFLNSLFSQSASKKKKKSAMSSMTSEDYDVNEGGGSGWRRRRRSSISHFRCSSSVKSTAMAMTDSKSLYSSSSSEFRTPPPSKSYKDRRSQSGFINSTIPAGFLVQNDMHSGCGGGNRAGLVYKYGETGEMEKEFTRIGKSGYDDEHNNDSDSSSDLFELQNYDLGYCSSGLPVYETTGLDSVKRGPAMSNAAAA